MVRETIVGPGPYESCIPAAGTRLSSAQQATPRPAGDGACSGALMDMQTTQKLTEAVPQLGRYQIDPGGSSVTFRTRHLFGLAPVRGRFAFRGGTVDVTEPLTGARVSAEIESASFHTGNRQRDTAVRSAQFLAAGEHPVLAFSSEGLDGPVLNGTLTVRGMSRPVSVQIEVTGVDPRWFTARATVRIDRYDFGVTASRGLAGRYLDITMEVRCVRS